MRDHRDHQTCACGEAGRRDFLKQAAALVSGALAVAAGSPLAARGAELTYPIPAADGAVVDRDNGVILVRYQGKVFAFNLSCPHENAAVRWKAAVGRFECSRHDSRYEPNGAYTSGRATRNMDRFAVRRAGDTVVVDIARLIQSDTQKAQWEAAAVLL
jgi:nitrite reductase/ring-hydroxylating ferredoxin subunit